MQEDQKPPKRENVIDFAQRKKARQDQKKQSHNNYKLAPSSRFVHYLQVILFLAVVWYFLETCRH